MTTFVDPAALIALLRLAPDDPKVPRATSACEAVNDVFARHPWKASVAAGFIAEPTPIIPETLRIAALTAARHLYNLPVAAFGIDPNADDAPVVPTRDVIAAVWPTIAPYTSATALFGV